jgi:hypothetical protein
MLLANGRSHATALRVLATSLAFQDRLVAAAELLVEAQLDRSVFVLYIYMCNIYRERERERERER